MQRLELPQNARQDEFGNGHARAQQQRTADLTGEFAHARVHFVRQRENFFCITQHQLARRRERYAPAAALEQPRVKMFLQLLHLKRHRRLCHAKLLGRLGKRKVPGYTVENL